MDNFEWLTDEDAAADLGEPEPEQPGAPNGRRLRIVIFLVVLAVIAGGYWAYQTGVDHVAEATEQVEADVRASHELVRRAGLQADLPLFQRFLSSSDQEWAQTEEQLVVDERWLDRSMLGLSWQETLSSTAAITISADLRSAEAVSYEQYGYSDGDGEEKTSRLARTHVYRLGPDRWLYASPRAEDWGEEEVIDLPRLRLTYPARDGELAEQLAADLNNLIERTCSRRVGLNCPVYFRLSARFAKNPELLQSGQPGSVPLWTQRPLTLPTPGLIGLPLDEDAYDALFLGYARPTVAAAMADVVGWRCCQGGLFFQALVEQQWGELGLRPLPDEARAEVYGQLLQAHLDVGHADDLWMQAPLVGDSPSLQSARIILSFLQQRYPQASAGQWQYALADADRYEQWLAAVTNGGAGPALAMGWHSYLQVQSAEEETYAPPEPPSEDLLLMCKTEQDQPALWRFDAQMQSFVPEIEELHADGKSAPLQLWPAPPDGAIFATGEPDSLQIHLWRDGQQTLIWAAEPGSGRQFSFLGASPDGRFVMAEEHGLQETVPPYRAAEVSTCLENRCHWRPSNYLTYWSPDGGHVINVRPEQNLLFVVESTTAAQAFRYMDSGNAPVWLDEETFAYVQTNEGELGAIMLMSVGRPRAQTLVDLAQLLALLPPTDATVRPDLGLVRHPTDENVLFLALRVAPDRLQDPGVTGTTHVYLARRDTGQLFNLFSTVDGDARSLAISPAGRWLSVVTREGLLLYDLVEDRGTVGVDGPIDFVPQWSPSGEWLYVASEGRHYLVAPGLENRELTAEPLACGHALWLGAG